MAGTAISLDPAPNTDAIVGQAVPGARWAKWFNSLRAFVNRAPVTVGDGVDLETQGASIGATALPTGTLTAGLYRVVWTLRITRAATTSSSLEVGIGFTHGGVGCTFASAAFTGNTTSTVGTGSYLVNVDAATAISYATTYASVGGTSMQYALSIRVELVP